MATYELMANDDLIENPSPRCACMVVLDTSGSMGGTPIAQLNTGFRHFVAALQEDEVAACSVELGVITAGGNATEVLPFTTAMHIDDVSQFSASGGTPLGQATEMALKRLEERKKEYQRAGVAYYQPWLVIISDGSPTDSYQQAMQQANNMGQQGKLVVLPVGVDGADMKILNQFSHRGAKKLAGLQFNEFFEWLSASMSRVSASASTSASVSLPSTNGWESI